MVVEMSLSLLVVILIVSGINDSTGDFITVGDISGSVSSTGSFGVRGAQQ